MRLVSMQGVATKFLDVIFADRNDVQDVMDSTDAAGTATFLDQYPTDVSERIAFDILSQLPQWALECCRENVRALVQAGTPLRVASMYSGSDLSIGGLQAFLKTLLPDLATHPSLGIHHVMSVEWVPWKRNFIMNVWNPDTVFGDAKDLLGDGALDYVSGETMAPPFCTVMEVGFSCKSFSALNNNRAEFSRGIFNIAGSSGLTAKYAMEFVKHRLPAILLIENVPGLFAGYIRNDFPTNEMVVNLVSNLNILLEGP
eukprot:6490945-Amphidinium_carterae.1